MRWMGSIIVACLVAITLAITLAAQESSAPTRTLEACETDLLDVRSALIDAQEQLALWQARAIQAEAKLAREAIARERAARKSEAPK